MATVAETIVSGLAESGVRHGWGVVGDALNPVTDAIHRSEDITWMGVRLDEVGALAASGLATC